MEPVWRVLIADDEPVIRSGIRQAVDWERIKMTVAAEAEDGEEALELAVQHEVHVLLVDLNMPIMNGLTLIRELRGRLPGCRIVIVSGHDEFMYAQEAIRLQVDDFLLKPVHPAQLQSLLEKLAGDMERDVLQSEYLKIASEQVQKNLPLLRVRFCLDWIDGNITEGEVRERLAFLGMPPYRPAQLLLVRWTELRADVPLMGEKDRQLFLFAMENMVSEWLAPYAKVVFRDSSDGIVVILWEPAPEGLFDEIERSIQIYLKLAVRQHMEPVGEDAADIASAYRRAKAALNRESRISPVVRRARQLMLQFYADPDLSLDKLAQTIQVSPVYLSRIIKQELETTFVSLLTQIRISKAIQLLHSTDLSILEIAERTGYDSQHYFSTAFKKVMKVSPVQYRKGALFEES